MTDPIKSSLESLGAVVEILTGEIQAAVDAGEYETAGVFSDALSAVIGAMETLDCVSVEEDENE